MWRLNTKRLGVVVGLAAVLALVPSARAAEALFTPDCTTDNLLARKAPSQRQDLRGNFWLVTDEAVAPEGAQWDSPVAIVLDTPAGSVTYDLGQPTSVSAFYVQADANDTYKIFGSLDGTAEQLQDARRGRHRPGPRPARPHGDHQPDDRALRAHRRGAGRRFLFDLRVLGVLPPAHAVPAAVPQGRRAAGARARGAVVEVLLVRQRRERALRDAARAGRRWD